jgi:hypothetical protein
VGLLAFGRLEIWTIEKKRVNAGLKKYDVAAFSVPLVKSVWQVAPF